jgi:hypothetical protein
MEAGERAQSSGEVDSSSIHADSHCCHPSDGGSRHDRGRAIAKVRRRRARHRIKRRLPVEPGNFQCSHQDDCNIGRGFLRNQPDAVGPGGLGQKAPFHHPGNPADAIAERAARAGRRVAGYVAPDGAATGALAGTGTTGPALTIGRVDRGRVTGPFSWRAMQFTNGKLRKRIKGRSHPSGNNGKSVGMRKAHGSSLETPRMFSANRRGRGKG